MEVCKIVNGRYMCKNEIEPHIRPDKSLYNFHNLFEKHLDKYLPKENHIRHTLHPALTSSLVKPSIQTVPNNVKQLALLNKASNIYYATNSIRDVESFLTNNKVDYVIDWELSTKDGLVAINNNTNKATLALRGTHKTHLPDWIENIDYGFTQNVKSPINTHYGQRMQTFLEDVKSTLDVEHITGYSKGGFGAITLGDHNNISTTTFNPAVTLGNAIYTNNVNHNIYHTTEDIVSVLARPMQIRNKNVKIDVVEPLANYNLINPIDTHKIDNFFVDSSRRQSIANELANQLETTGKRISELEISKIGQQAIDKGLSYTEFVREVNPADVEINLIKLTDADSSVEFSQRMKRNDIHHKVWKELGGQFSQDERQAITKMPESEYLPRTGATERIDYARAPSHIQKRIEQQHINNIESTSSKLNEVHESNQEALNSRGTYLRSGATNALAMGAGIVADKSLPDFSYKPEAVAGITSAVGAGLTATPLAPTIVAGEAAFKLGDVAGYEASQFAKSVGANREIQEDVGIMATSAVGVPTFSAILSGITETLVAAGLSETAVPLPGFRPLAAFTLATAGITKGLSEITK